MNIFKQFIRSIYSPKDIASFRNQGIGKTILYVFFLSLITVIPTMIYFSTAFTNGISSAKETIQEEIPSFTIKDGQLQTDQTEPIFIDRDDFTIVLDGTGAVDQASLKNRGNTIGILKDEFVLIAGGQTESYSYSLMNDLTISKKDFTDFLNVIEKSLVIIIPIVIIISFIFASALQFIEISIVAAFGLLIKNSLRKNLQYRHLWRMSACAVTLPTVFFFIMDFLKTAVPSAFLINFFVSLVILLLAIKDVPGEVNTED